ncbi:hypothetical protein F5I97DRAFT_1860838 [Phlebopus sp. FC_14]|nr:hypothetical protein F5I97DRAFT_1860838 [Phlebopus sp. FC_14]
MKIGITDEKFKGHTAATLKGALEGTLLGSGIALPTMYLLNRRWPYFRTLPPTLKTLGVVIVVTPLTSIRAEQRAVEYDRQQWTDAGKSVLEKRLHAEQERWVSLSAKEKLADWTARHQLSVIAGSWVLATIVAGNIILRDPYLSMPHKVVQVRVWAQGLTIGVVIAAAALTHSHRAEAVAIREHGGDHSWQEVLEQRRMNKAQAK